MCIEITTDYNLNHDIDFSFKGKAFKVDHSRKRIDFIHETHANSIARSMGYNNKLVWRTATFSNNECVKSSPWRIIPDDYKFYYNNKKIKPIEKQEDEELPGEIYEVENQELPGTPF